MHSDTTEAHVIALLKSYITDKKTIEAIHHAMARTTGVSFDDMTKKMSFARTDDLGASLGDISDRTTYIMLNNQQKTDDDNDSASEIVAQIVALENKCGEIETLIPVLESKQREVIRLRYIIGLKRPEICAKIGFAPRTYDKYHREAINHLCELYEKVYGHKELGKKET